MTQNYNKSQLRFRHNFWTFQYHNSKVINYLYFTKKNRKNEGFKNSVTGIINPWATARLLKISHERCDVHEHNQTNLTASVKKWPKLYRFSRQKAGFRIRIRTYPH
jgi:hypothetical protein